MSGFSAELRRILGPAIAAARIALASFDEDRIPVSLQRVRAYSGGRLPVPFAVSLLDALESDSDLRGQALEHLDEARSGRASAAFLRREHGWWIVVSAELERRVAENAARREEADLAQLEKMKNRLEVATARLRDSQAEWHSERERLLEREQRRPRPVVSLSEIKNRDERIASIESQLAEEQMDRLMAEKMVARLQDRLRRSRRNRRSRDDVVASTSSMGSDPVIMARQLDLVASSALYRSGEKIEERRESRRALIRLPAGVRPDDSAAIDWLSSSTDPILLLVDGYNVLYVLNPRGFATGQARSRLIADLGRLLQRARALRVTVVFDSSLSGDPDRRVADNGVEVRFTLRDDIADDEIVTLSRDTIGSVIVLTSDRDLQARVEALGGLALFSEAFASWVAR